MNISQEKILNKIALYLSEEKRSCDLIYQFKHRGYCHGLGVLTAYGLYLKSQTKQTCATEQDDWRWLKSTLIAVAAFRPTDQLSSGAKANFDRLIALLEYFQHISTYQTVSQGNLHHYLETTTNELIQLEYKFAGIFKASDFHQTLQVTIKERPCHTTLFDILTRYSYRLILISGGKHTLSLFKKGSHFSLYDANARGGRKRFALRDSRAMIREIYKMYHYDRKQPAAFGFRIFTFHSPLMPYPDPKDVLSSLHRHQIPSFTGKYGPLHIAARIDSTQCIEYYLKHHAELDSTTTHGSTPLLVAAKRGHLASVDYLLRHGASMNEQHAIKSAAKRGYIEVVLVLLSYEKGDPLQHLQFVLKLLPNDTLRLELLTKFQDRFEDPDKLEEPEHRLRLLMP